MATITSSSFMHEENRRVLLDTRLKAFGVLGKEDLVRV